MNTRWSARPGSAPTSLGALSIVAMVELGAGDTGIIRFVGWFVVFSIAGVALRWIFRA